MRHLMLALMVLMTAVPSAGAGKYSPKPVPGGGFPASPALPQVQMPKFESPIPTVPVAPRLLEPLQPGELNHPVLVVPPEAPAREPPPDVELVECLCRCADGACADQQDGLCTSDAIDATGEKVRYACQ